MKRELPKSTRGNREFSVSTSRNRELTDEQRLTARIIAETGSVGRAATALSCSVEKITHWICNLDAFRAEIHDYRTWILQSYGASVGLRALIDLASDVQTPANARLQAAKTLLDLAGHNPALAASQVAARQRGDALDSLSADRLERLIAGAQATLDALRRQAATIDVPHDSARGMQNSSALL